ncbi:hypothetical protein HHK36_015484 [Tetracentron sinense]|uniref:Uncharacterized protein n=1 Tax=Tetracentron sinense TaxID=13715 RepID=A0A834Z582_TETSI|nr:hypothetical protein HHK36_015484 [Tetracentron sinense]
MDQTNTERDRFKNKNIETYRAKKRNLECKGSAISGCYAAFLWKEQGNGGCYAASLWRSKLGSSAYTTVKEMLLEIGEPAPEELMNEKEDEIRAYGLFEEFPRGIMMKRHNLELVRRIEFLKGIGILGNEIDRVFYLFPGILGVGVEDRHGLIRREAFKMLEREPRSIIYELVDIEKKIEFLVHKMGFSIGCLIEVPEYLGVNFEKQIIPRYSVIEYLRSKGGLGSEVGLKGLIKPDDTVMSLNKREYMKWRKEVEASKLKGQSSGPFTIASWSYDVRYYMLQKPQPFLEHNQGD